MKPETLQVFQPHPYTRKLNHTQQPSVCISIQILYKNKLLLLWVVGDEASINFWFDKWVPELILSPACFSLINLTSQLADVLLIYLLFHICMLQLRALLILPKVSCLPCVAEWIMRV